MATNVGRMQFGSVDRHAGTKQSERGRVCSAPGCTTVLSIYNDRTECSVHEGRVLRFERAKP
jgi:hypothetical protein